VDLRHEPEDDPLQRREFLAATAALAAPTHPTAALPVGDGSAATEWREQLEAATT
jgi:hypothetical protein